MSLGNKGDNAKDQSFPTTVLIAGCVSFTTSGKRHNQGPETVFYMTPTKLPVPSTVKFVSTGAAASHGFAVDSDGSIYAFGLNTSGQLGLGHCNFVCAGKPEIIPSKSIPGTPIALCCGKRHSLLLLDNGKVMACGDNSLGQLGTGKLSELPSTTFKPVSLLPGVTAVAISVGIDFNLVLDAAGQVYGFGSGEFGKLGFGTEGTYNASSSSVKMTIQPYPTPRAVFVGAKYEGIKIVSIAAGSHHAHASTTDGKVFSWGCGSYGRLGLGQHTADALSPTEIDRPQWRRGGLAPKLLVSGATHTVAVSVDGTTWVWGRVRQVEEAKMYPQLCYDLSGWDVRSVAPGNQCVIVAANESVISWGVGSGELGLGEDKKNSSKPAKSDILEGIYVRQVAAGLEHSLFLCEQRNAADTKLFEERFVFAGPTDGYPEEEKPVAAGKGGKAGGKAVAAPPAKKRKT